MDIIFRKYLNYEHTFRNTLGDKKVYEGSFASRRMIIFWLIVTVELRWETRTVRFKYRYLSMHHLYNQKYCIHTYRYDYQTSPLRTVDLNFGKLWVFWGRYVVLSYWMFLLTMVFCCLWVILVCFCPLGFLKGEGLSHHSTQNLLKISRGPHNFKILYVLFSNIQTIIDMLVCLLVLHKRWLHAWFKNSKNIVPSCVNMCLFMCCLFW